MAPFIVNLLHWHRLACLEKQLQGPNTGVSTPPAPPPIDSSQHPMQPATALFPPFAVSTVRPREVGQVASGSRSVVGIQRDFKRMSVVHQAIANLPSSLSAEAPGTFSSHTLDGFLLPVREDVVSKEAPRLNAQHSTPMRTLSFYTVLGWRSI